MKFYKIYGDKLPENLTLEDCKKYVLIRLKNLLKKLYQMIYKIILFIFYYLMQFVLV